MGDTTKEERQRILDAQSPEAQAIDQKMRDAVAKRKAKYPDDAKAQAEVEPPKPVKPPKKYKKGGMVRGHGCATQGVKKAKGHY